MDLFINILHLTNGCFCSKEGNKRSREKLPREYRMYRVALHRLFTKEGENFILFFKNKIVFLQSTCNQNGHNNWCKKIKLMVEKNRVQIYYGKKCEI